MQNKNYDHNGGVDTTCTCATCSQQKTAEVTWLAESQ